MVFTDDTELSLAALAALVNSGADGEQLPDVDALDAFVQRWSWTGSRRRGATELAAVQALRPRLRRFWTSDRDAVVVLVNELLAEFRALPQLVRHDRWDYHLHATSDTAPLADRMAVEAAMALVDVVRADELGRLRICGNDDCTNVLVDLSRNRSKRYCDLTCTNRAAVRAYRSRSAGA
ncbi:CGNR zinc finger domain-containing protein [Nakamurella deserti]|uniref:CGNR zinc finger domain-containing protein n=1 Tax=Nakamurella deserti TaxID=2164074 RepID=UPI000DBE23DF|nr:CGNR zinc finger domain-containing protein [Nakamurella deserti]